MKKAIFFIFIFIFVSGCTTISRKLGKEIEFSVILKGSKDIEYSKYKVELGGCYIANILWPICSNRDLAEKEFNKSGQVYFKVPLYGYYFISIFNESCEFKPYIVDQDLEQIKKTSNKVVVNVQGKECEKYNNTLMRNRGPIA